MSQSASLKLTCVHDIVHATYIQLLCHIWTGLHLLVYLAHLIITCAWKFRETLTYYIQTYVYVIYHKCVK
jgi:hypothetical protein